MSCIILLTLGFAVTCLLHIFWRKKVIKWLSKALDLRLGFGDFELEEAGISKLFLSFIILNVGRRKYYITMRVSV
jgi:hypothetical protein